MLSRIALFLLCGTSVFATIPPCDRVELWRQLAPLKELSQAALISQASSGDAFAQFFVSGLYLEGKRVDKNESVGVSWLQQSAVNGFSRAQLLLGEVYETGKVLQRDPQEALAWYNKAAEQGDCEAEFFLGMHYLGRHFDVASDNWELNGQKDTRMAVAWLWRAGEHGDPDAQVQLGQLYETGEGIVQNYAAAVFWYQKAADHGPDLGGAGQGRNELGLLYFEGLGVQKDYIEAYKWFAIAGNKSEEQVAAHMTNSELEEAKRRVREWKQQHAGEIMEANKVFRGSPW